MDTRTIGRAIRKNINPTVAIGVGLITAATGGGILAIAGRALTWGGVAKTVGDLAKSRRRESEVEVESESGGESA